MRTQTITSLAALMFIFSTTSASAIELVNGDRGSEMSTESGTEGANSSSTSESSVDTSASQTNSSYEASSSADAQFTTQASSFASSESGLVIPSAFAIPDNPFLWGSGSSTAKTQPVTSSPQPTREIHMLVKNYYWPNRHSKTKQF